MSAHKHAAGKRHLRCPHCRDRTSHVILPKMAECMACGKRHERDP